MLCVPSGRLPAKIKTNPTKTTNKWATWAVVDWLTGRRHDDVFAAAAAAAAAAADVAEDLMVNDGVRTCVLVQMVAPHELLLAERTREPFVAGVRPHVTLQFVRAQETLAAVQPAARERSFAGVPAQVCLEVRRLVVHLAATGDVTAVHSDAEERTAAGL